MKQDGTQRTTNGFSVGYNATVTIGKEVTAEGAPQINGYACGIAIENNGGLMLTNPNSVSVTVRGGTVLDAQRPENGNAIWQGNGSAVLKLGECTFNIANSSNLAISGNKGQWTDVLENTSLKVYAKATSATSYTSLLETGNYYDRFMDSVAGYNKYVISASVPNS